MYMVKCCIAGCTQTQKRKNDGEWICGRHWRRVPAKAKAAIRHAERRNKPTAAIDRLWASCKRHAGKNLEDLWRFP